ncbi:MAG: hypothetical protein R3Y47_02875 [Lachnospiraceae bacterium]
MKEIVQVWQDVSGSGMLLALYVFSVLFLLYEEKEQYKKILFVFFPGAWCIILLTPITYEVITSVVDTDIYYRFFWILPMMPTVAYAMVMLVRKIQPKTKKENAILVLCIAGILVLSGDFVYNNWRFSFAENIYHIPQEIVDVCDAVELEGREVLVAFPLDQMQYVRQYNAKICMPYGRDSLVAAWSILHPLYDEMEREILDAESLARELEASACVYVVLYSDTEIIGDLEEYGYSFKEQISSMDIYENLKMLDATY